MTQEQYDRAIERLTVALEMEPDNAKSNCLMSEAYKLKKEPEEAMKYELKCIKQ